MQFKAHSEMVDGVEVLWAESMFRREPVNLAADTRDELMELAMESASIHEPDKPFAVLIWGLP